MTDQTRVPLYVQEHIVELPSCGHNGRPGARQVKMFVKGPVRGVGRHTRILVQLHGLGGRNHEINYKKFRRYICDESDCIVVGIDYFGTQSLWIDPLHYQREYERLGKYLKTMLASKGGGRWNPEQGIFVKPSSEWFTTNAYSAGLLGQSAPEDCWDYGAIQALDVLAGIRWLLDDLRRHDLHDQRPIHMLSKSSGCQVGACIIKIIPDLVSSLVEVGPLIFSAKERGSLGKLLTDPTGDDSTGRVRVMSFKEEVTAYVLRKVPVLLPILPVEPPLLDDHIDLRQVDMAHQWEGHRSSTRVLSFQGDQDPALGLGTLEEIQAFRRQVGMECSTDVIGKALVDGVVFTGDGHDVAEDMLAFQRYIAPRMFSSSHPAPWPEQWNNRFLRSRNGTWIINWEPQISLTFKLDA